MRTMTLATLLIILCPSAASAIVVSDVIGSHTTTPGVPAFGLNVDGVVAIGSQTIPHGTGSLIADRHVLTAAHLVDGDADGIVDPSVTGQTVFFQLPGGWVGVPVQSAVVPVDWAGGLSWHDLAVIQLAEDAPAEAPRYPLYGGEDEIGRTVVVVGYGSTGRGDTGEDLLFEYPRKKRTGLNRYEADSQQVFGDDVPSNMLVYDFDSGLEANNTLAIGNLAQSDLGFGDEEVMVAAGDSGGPIFLDGAIAGITSFGLSREDGVLSDYTPADDSSWGEIALDTRVSFYRDFLTAATDGQAVFVVPEPGTLLLLSMATLCLSLWRLRRAVACSAAEPRVLPETRQQPTHKTRKTVSSRGGAERKKIFPLRLGAFARDLPPNPKRPRGH